MTLVDLFSTFKCISKDATIQKKSANDLELQSDPKIVSGSNILMLIKIPIQLIL